MKESSIYNFHNVKVISCSSPGDVSYSVKIQSESDIPLNVFSVIESFDESTTHIQYYFTVSLNEALERNFTLLIFVNDQFGSISATYKVSNCELFNKYNYVVLKT